MKISTEFKAVSDVFGRHKALEMVAAAGFDCADISFGDMATGEESHFLQPDAVEYCHYLRRHAEDLGMTVNQTHAPFRMDHSPWLEGRREDLLRRLGGAIRLSGVLGARNVVVHPLQCMNYLNNDPQWILEQNVEFYSALAPYAEDAGVKIAIENMWQKNRYNNRITLSVCSSPYELRDYVDACNRVSPVFTACLDVGHCILTGHDPVNAIEVLGSRLDALHIHDVDGINDNHTCPMTMIVDFPAIVEKLRQTGYAGEWTLESTFYFKEFATEDYGKALDNLAKVSRQLLNP